MQVQTSETHREISDAEVEAEMFRVIKAYEDRPQFIKNAVKEQIQGIPEEQIRRALERLSQRSIVV